MAKKKSIAKAASKKNHAANPPFLTDATQMIVPGVAAYAVARLSGRALYMMVGSKNPKLAPWAGALGPIITAAGLWYAAHKSEKLSEYHDSIVVGASIAAIQSFFQIALPQIGWALSDFHAGPAAALPSAESGAPVAQEGYDSLPDLDEMLLPPIAGTSDDDYADVPEMNNDDLNAGVFAD